ncbi:MAG: GAF domain-containing protein, partial [Planctomycetota bacterium]|nr:GAF domain-containing protein [Planctomycetota bacterium]
MAQYRELKILDEIGNLLRLDVSLAELLGRFAEILQTEIGFRTVVVSLADKDGQFLERKALAGLDISGSRPLAREQVPVRHILRLLKARHQISRSYYFPHKRAGQADTPRTTNGESAERSFEAFPALEIPDPAPTRATHVSASRGGTRKTRRISTARRKLAHTGDLLLLPLLSSGKRLIGVISLYSSLEGHAPDPKYITVSEVVANLAEKAIENTLTYQQVNNKLAELHALSEVAAVVNSVLDMPTLLNRIVTIIRETFGYRKAMILLADKNESELSIRAHVGYSNADFADVRIPIVPGGGIAGTVAYSGNFALIPDLDSYTGPYFDVGTRAKSEVAVPIRLKERVIGVLDVESERKNAFADEDVKLLDQFANQIAIAISNAQLYQDAQSELASTTSLVKVGSAIGSVREVDSLLQDALAILANIFKFTNAAIMLTTEDKTELVLTAQHGEFPSALPGQLRVRIGEEGVTGLAAHTGKTLNIGDVRKFPSYVRGLPDARSELAIPLMHGDELLGVLNLESKEVNAFAERDVALLELFAMQIAFAIDNARLYQQTLALAVTDPLTGLSNRRLLQERLGSEARRSRRLKH